MNPYLVSVYCKQTPRLKPVPLACSPCARHINAVQVILLCSRGRLLAGVGEAVSQGLAAVLVLGVLLEPASHGVSCRVSPRKKGAQRTGAALWSGGRSTCRSGTGCSWPSRSFDRGIMSAGEGSNVGSEGRKKTYDFELGLGRLRVLGVALALLLCFGSLVATVSAGDPGH